MDSPCTIEKREKPGNAKRPLNFRVRKSGPCYVIQLFFRRLGYNRKDWMRRRRVAAGGLPSRLKRCANHTVKRVLRIVVFLAINEIRKRFFKIVAFHTRPSLRPVYTGRRTAAKVRIALTHICPVVWVKFSHSHALVGVQRKTVVAQRGISFISYFQRLFRDNCPEIATNHARPNLIRQHRVA